LALTLAGIRDKIRRRLGWPAVDDFVLDSELEEMIRASRFELLDLLISIHQGEYRAAFGTLTTQADRNLYLMGPIDPSPAYGFTPDILGDFSRIRKVAFLVNDRYIPMKRWDVETSVDRADSVVWEASTDIRYRLSSGITAGDAEKLIFFHPTPAGEYTVQIWGNEGIENLSFTDTTTINALGNDEYLVLDCMIKCLQMEESDPSLVERQKMRFIEMLQNNGPPMDAGQAATIQDVRGAWDDIENTARWR
jgi:hypothetical protein